MEAPALVLALAAAAATPPDPVVYHAMGPGLREKRAFRTDELPSLFRDETGVDTSDIWERWLR